MNIFSLTRVNSLSLKSRKNENYEENRKLFTNKIYFIFDFTYDIQFLFDIIWTTNKNTVVSHRKENFIESGKQRKFFYISYFNTFLYINFLTLLKC